MFSGIVEAKSEVLEATQSGTILTIVVARPPEFNDLAAGDSVCTNGICLTVESFNSATIQFALAAETLQVTQWSTQSLLGKELNLERSLKFGDRIHGHMVSGHVDAMAKVISSKNDQGSLKIVVEFPKKYSPMVWKKGSVTLNGVSLTVNEASHQTLEVCLIPETVKRTNLGELKAGDFITFEVDSMARGLVHFLENSPVKGRIVEV